MKAIVILLIWLPFISGRCTTTRPDGSETSTFVDQTDVNLQIHPSDGCNARANSDAREFTDDPDGSGAFTFDIVEQGKTEVLSTTRSQERALRFQSGTLRGCRGHVSQQVRGCTSYRVRVTPFNEVASGKYTCLIKKNGVVVRNTSFVINPQAASAANWTVTFYKGSSSSSSNSLSARCADSWFSTTSRGIDFGSDGTAWPADSKRVAPSKALSFCAVFKGSFTPPATGEYRFIGSFNKGAILKIDGATIFDVWSSPIPTAAGSLTLTANTKVDVEFWYYYLKDNSGPRVNLQYRRSTDTQTAQLVVRQNNDLIIPSITYFGYKCQTLDGSDPLDDTPACQSSPLPIPRDYFIPSRTSTYGRLATLGGFWGATQILFNDGCLISASTTSCNLTATVIKSRLGGMDVYSPSSCASANKILVCKDVGSNAEVVSSPKYVTFYGKNWAAIDGTDPSASVPSTCSPGYLRIPNGWAIAPGKSNLTRLAVLQYNFGSDALILADSSAIEPRTLANAGLIAMDKKTLGGIDYYGPILSGLNPGKKCPRILIHQDVSSRKDKKIPSAVRITNTVRSGDFEYAVLDNAKSGGRRSCQSSPLPVPIGWSIVPAPDSTVLSALRKFRSDFSADCLTFGNRRSITVPVTGETAGDCGAEVLNICNFQGADHHAPHCLSKRRRILIHRRIAAPASLGASASATDVSVTCGICSSTGDPHFTSFGGTKFSLYTKGREILTRSNSSWTGTAFSIESFQVPWGSKSVTVNGRISFIVGTENVTVSVPVVQTSTSLVVVTRNGAVLSPSNFNSGSPRIRVSLFNNDNKRFTLISTLSDGSGNSGDIIVSIDHSASGVHFLNFRVNMSSSIFVGRIEGLCGACGDKRTWCPRNIPFAVSSTNAASNQAFGECWSNGTIPPSTAPPHPCSIVSSSRAAQCNSVCSACNDTAANQEACLIDCCGSEPEEGSKTCRIKTIDDTNDGKETIPVCKVPEDFEKTKKVVRGHRCGTLNPPKTIGQLACDLDAYSETEFQVTFVNSSFANGRTTYCYDAEIDTDLCDAEDGCDIFKHFILQTTCPSTSHRLDRDNDTGNYGVIVPISAGRNIYCVSFGGNVFDTEGSVNMIVKGNTSKCGSAQIIAPDCTDETPLPIFVPGDRPSHIRPSDHSHAKATPLYKALARCQSQSLGCVTFLRADGKYVGIDTTTGKSCTPAATQTTNDCHQLGDNTGVFVVKGKHTHHNTDLKEKDDFTDRNERTDKNERDDLGNKCFAVGNNKASRPIVIPHTDVDSSFHVEVTARCSKKGTADGNTKNFSATCHAKLDNGDSIYVGKTDFDEDEDEHHTRIIEGSGISVPSGRTVVGLQVQFHFSGRKDGKAYFSNRVKVNAGAGHIHGGNLCGNAHFGSKLSGWTPLAGSIHEHSKNHDNTDDVQENTVSSKTGSLVLKGRGGNSGVSQLISIPADRNSVDAVFFSGYSKRITEVSGSTIGGYSLYVDIAYVDGTFDYGITAPFTAGPASNNWEYTERLYRLKEFPNGTNVPVKWVQVTPLLRNYTGDAAFDNVFITVIEKCSGLPRESAFSAADPHLTTLDGHYYDVQRLGDFVLIQDNSLAINVRHSRAGQAAVNSIIRLRYRSQTDIIIERASETNDPHFSVNGATLSLNTDEKYVFGNVEVVMTGKMDRAGSFLKYEFTFPTGHAVVVTAHISATQNGRQWLQVFPRYPRSSAGKTNGLLGNFNGDVADDFTDAFGNVLPLDISVEELYERFVDSWKAPMSYIVQESFNSNNPTDVLEIKTIADFPAEQVARVRQQCSVLTDKNLIEGCVLDVLLGEDESFVNAFLAVSQVNVIPQPIPLVQTQGSSALTTAVCFLTFVVSLALALF